jgi:hypothetical protein
MGSPAYVAVKPVALSDETKTTTQLPLLRAQPGLVALKLDLPVLEEAENVLVTVMSFGPPTVTV